MLAQFGTNVVLAFSVVISKADRGQDIQAGGAAVQMMHWYHWEHS